jgi:probable phosphoglycerate mutase
MKIYLIRHGDPDYGNDTLTERGHEEARALVPYLKAEGIERIISSPMGRAQATAAHTANDLDLEVETEEWIAELQLRTAEPMQAAWDIHCHIIRNDEYLKDVSRPDRISRLPIEQADAAIARIRESSDEFLSRLGYARNGGSYRVTASNQAKIAVFAHGGFGLCWLSTLLEIPYPLMWSGFFLHTSSVTQILFDEREPGIATPRCIMMSALPHLFARSMEPGTGGIKANYV